MKRVFLLYILVLIGFILSAQPGTTGIVRGGVKAGTTADLDGTTAELVRAADSVLVRTALTDGAGQFQIDQVPEGTFRVRASRAGFAPIYSESFSVSAAQATVSLPDITLITATTELKGVTVTARKPFIQKLSDRIVVNVDGSIVSAGSTALEVLERAPGVTVDQNDAVSLRGRTGVIFMIDGKVTPMSGTDLAAYLRGLPSGAIDRIDIITNPSAKYDAAGNAGIIDIRLKKDQRFGTNGTFTAGYGQGVYPKANAGTTFNYRDKKMNVFGNYNYSYRQNLNHLFINRNFFEGAVFKGSDDKDNYSVMPFTSHTARLGADFFPTKHTTIGFVVNSNFNHLNRTATIGTIVNDLFYKPEFTFQSIATNNDHFNNTVANINFKHTFDSLGTELTADMDYGVFNSGSLTRTASHFYNLDGSKKGDDEILDGDQSGDLTFKTGKIDFVHPMKGGLKLETGAKTSFVTSDNDAKFYNVFAAGSVTDSTKTNRFFYNEYNNAVYINGSKQAKKWDLTVGLRGEQTHIKTRQVKGAQQFTNDYFKLFPSAFFNYKLKEDQTIGLSVSRRIERPGYQQLNPFLFQIDATVYATGEPQLRPELNWSYEASYTVKQLNFTLGYSHTTDPQTVVISRILDVIPTFEIKEGQDSNITVQIPVNLTSSDYVGLSATVPAKITTWWNMMNNLDLFYNHYNGSLGGALLNNGSPAARIRSNNTFTLKKGWNAELIGSLNSGGRYGYMVTKTQGGVAAGVQKSVLKNKGTLKFNVTDIFWTNLPRATVTYPGRYIENWHAVRESRVATLNFTYRFGNSKVQGARRRTTASEEERQRAGN